MTEDPWEPRAKCLGRSDEFELSDWPEPEERFEREPDPDYQDWINSERRKFAESEEVCLNCPVFVQCQESASKEDKKWTMRAGEWPTMLIRAEAYPAYMCGRPSHLGRATARHLPYCPKCLRDNNGGRISGARRPTTRAGRREAHERRLAKLVD